MEKQLHALPVASGVEGSTLEEEAVIRNLQEQVQLSEKVCVYVRCKAIEIQLTDHLQFFRLYQVQCPCYSLKENACLLSLRVLEGRINIHFDVCIQ